MNLHKLAIDISKVESGKKEINIAQIKECLKCTLELLGKYKDKEIIEAINKYR